MGKWTAAYLGSYTLGFAVLTGIGVPAGTAPLISGALTAIAFSVAALRRKRGQGPVRSHLRAIERLSREIEDVTDHADLGALLTGTLHRVLRPHCLYLWLPSQESTDYHLVAGVGPELEVRALPAVWVQDYLTALASAEGGPNLVSGLAPWMKTHGLAVCKPIVWQGRPIGLLTMSPRADGLPFASGDRWLLNQSLRQVGLALSYMGLQKEERRRRSRLDNMTSMYKDAELRAITDGLTGLNTHAFFKEQLEKRFHETRRHKAPLSIMLVDIDHFKKFNDTFGHPIGDEVLRLVAAAVKHAARTGDTVARYGGEELSLVLPQTDLAGAMILAERIRESITELELTDHKGRRLPTITVSVGVAEMEPKDTVPSAIVDRADQAMYAAKRQGRNMVCQAS